MVYPTRREEVEALVIVTRNPPSREVAKMRDPFIISAPLEKENVTSSFDTLLSALANYILRHTGIEFVCIVADRHLIVLACKANEQDFAATIESIKSHINLAVTSQRSLHKKRRKMAEKLKRLDDPTSK